MNILAIETSSKIGSLSLWQGEKEKNWVGNGEISRSEDLLPAIAGILSENKISKSELDLLLVSEGPGSFTGLRVGISLAQALAFSLSIKCLGISILEALAVGGNFIVKGKRRCTAVTALAKNVWCYQEFVISKGMAVNRSEIILAQADELFLLIKMNPEHPFVVDLETYRRFFLDSLGKELSRNVISVGQNLATWIGLAAKGKLGHFVEEANVLPKYLF